MSPEAAAHVAKARALLGKARRVRGRRVRGVPTLRDQAARIAYHAGFHSAQALIIERMGKAPKTHRGVRTCFARVVEKEPRLDRTLTRFLGWGHQFEQVVDYGVGPRTHIPDTEAWQVIDLASSFVDRIEQILA